MSETEMRAKPIQRFVTGKVSRITYHAIRNPQPGEPDRYCTFLLRDEQLREHSCILWPDDFAEYGHLVELHKMLWVSAILDRRGKRRSMLVVQNISSEGE